MCSNHQKTIDRAQCNCQWEGLHWGLTASLALNTNTGIPEMRVAFIPDMDEGGVPEMGVISVSEVLFNILSVEQCMTSSSVKSRRWNYY